jgi:hypothetical protein
MQMYAPDDGRGDARNMLSHTWTSSNKLVKLLHLFGSFIWIVWWCTDLPASKIRRQFSGHVGDYCLLKEGICCIKLVDYVVSYDKTVAQDASDNYIQSTLQLNWGSSKFDALAQRWHKDWSNFKNQFLTYGHSYSVPICNSLPFKCVTICLSTV